MNAVSNIGTGPNRGGGTQNLYKQQIIEFDKNNTKKRWVETNNKLVNYFEDVFLLADSRRGW